MSRVKTIYCDKPHRLSDGAPVGHACRVLDPAYLRAEDAKAYDTATALLAAMRLVLHEGVPEEEPR